MTKLVKQDGQRYGWRGAFILPTEYFEAPAGGTALKVWDGSAWVVKPVKVWDGSAWVTKPVKQWSGSAWL